jgi:hypothetical protein
MVGHDDRQSPTRSGHLKKKKIVEEIFCMAADRERFKELVGLIA